MPFRARGKGGGATAGVAFIRAKDDADHAVRVHHPKADHEWVLRTEEGTAATPAALRIAGDTDGAANYLDVTLPDEFIRHDRSQNDFDLAIALSDSTLVSAVAARINVPLRNNYQSGVTVTHRTPGAAGNSFRFTVQYSYGAAPSFRYTSATAGTFTVGLTGHTIQNALDAINGARHNGTQIVAAAAWNTGTGATITEVRNATHPLGGGVDSGDPLAFEYGSRSLDEFLLTLAAADTLAGIKAIMEGWSYAGHKPFDGKVALTGDGTDTVASALIPSQSGDANALAIDFAGGVDPEAPTATVNDDIVTLTYVSAFHFLDDLVGEYPSGVEVTEVPGTAAHVLASEAGADVPFDFDERGDVGDATVEMGAEIASATWAFAAADTFAAPSSGSIPKPDSIEAGELWVVEVGGEASADVALIRPSLIPDVTGGVTAASAANGIAVEAVQGARLWLQWHRATAADAYVLRVATTNAAVDPAPLKFSRAKGVGARGPRGRAGEDAEAREVTLKTWQDGAAASAIPNDATETTVEIGRLHPVQYPKRSGKPRYLHAAVPEADRITIFSINGLEQVSQFREATSGADKLYHSPRLRTTDALDCLIRVEAASG